MNKIELLHGDCLELMKDIPDSSVDLILTDLPYGTIKGLGGEIEKYKRLSQSDWDETIDPKDIYNVANRILRKNGKMVLFSQEPYTTELVNKAIPNVPFCYRMVWEKDHFANCLLAKKAPVSFYEDILVFSKTHDTEGRHPLRAYFKKVRQYIPANTGEINKALDNTMSSHYFTNGAQFSIPVERDYDKLIQVFGIDKMEGFKTYTELKPIDDQFKKDLPSTFNLWEGGKYKSNILKYRKDYAGYHPTQKPVSLLEDLIKTFSNEGDLVVDLTMGSGSTGVACVNTNRNFIGIELDDEYFEIAKQRISEALNTPEQITMFDISELER